MRRRHTSPNDLIFAQLTVAAVALEFGMPDLSLTPPPTGAGIATKRLIFTRQVAMYLVQTTFDMTMVRTAELFGRHYSTVSHALNVVEDGRDDGVFDRKLTKVEDFLITSRDTFGGVA